MSAPIAVYGASGYTGRLVVAELVRRGLPHVVAGRSAARLRAAAAQAGTVAPVRTAAVEDRDALRHLLGDCAVVINCAGPFTRHGEAVVRAAVETGTHYLDTTGEQLYMQRVFEHWDAAARAAEVAVIPAMGFDYVPGDLVAHLAARGREPLRELVVAYSVQGFGPTRGTARSALEGMRSGGLAYGEGVWRPAGTGPLRASFGFPEPIGRRPVIAYPAGEVVTVPRHVRTDKVTALIDVATIVPATGGRSPAPAGDARRRARDAHPAARAGRARDRPAARGADRGAAPRRPLRRGRGRRRRGRRDRPRRRPGHRRLRADGGDAAHGAGLLAAENFDRSGVLAPATAFDPRPFLDALAEHGLSYELGRRRPAA